MAHSGMSMRYRSLSELLAARDAGTLPDGAKVVIDADGAFLEGEADEAVELYATDHRTLLVEALTALGLPVEVCPAHEDLAARAAA